MLLASCNHSRSECFLQDQAEINKLIPDECDIKEINIILRDLEEFIESLSLNKAIAKIHQLTNLCLAKKSVQKKGIPILISVLEPFVPHVAEYLSEKIKGKSMLCDSGWPKCDPSLVSVKRAKIAIQINGKLKKVVELSHDISKDHHL